MNLILIQKRRLAKSESSNDKRLFVSCQIKIIESWNESCSDNDSLVLSSLQNVHNSTLITRSYKTNMLKQLVKFMAIKQIGAELCKLIRSWRKKSKKEMQKSSRKRRRLVITRSQQNNTNSLTFITRNFWKSEKH